MSAAVPSRVHAPYLGLYLSQRMAWNIQVRTRPLSPSALSPPSRVTLALLFALSDRLMEMDLEQVGLMIRDWKRGKFSLTVTVAQILQSADKFNVTTETLNALQEGYALEIIKTALATHKRPDSKSKSQRSTPEKLSPVSAKEANISLVYKELVELELQVEADKEIIQKKIVTACEACEAAMTTLNQAICDEVRGY
jgi:RecG-like helicase